VADDVVRVVRVMDSLNRLRFDQEAELLAAWESASNVLATPRRGSKPDATPPVTGEIRPAA